MSWATLIEQEAIPFKHHVINETVQKKQDRTYPLSWDWLENLLASSYGCNPDWNDGGYDLGTVHEWNQRGACVKARTYEKDLQGSGWDWSQRGGRENDDLMI